MNVQFTTDPGAPVVQIKEEDALKAFPFDYDKLTEHLRKRYANFKCNQRYHQLRHPLKEDAKYCKVRLLVPGNPKSSKKEYYRSEVIKYFDDHYTKK